jgi:hypothetical protein
VEKDNRSNPNIYLEAGDLIMALTYTSLVSRIKDAAENDGTEFSDAVPDFIDRAELRLTREIDSLGLTNFATSFFVQGDPFLSKPDTPNRALIVRNVNFTTSTGRRTQLLLRSKDYLNDYWRDRTSVGSPRYYANYGAEQLLIAPAPASAYAVEMSYVAQPAALASTTNEQNYYTLYCANALFYASMVEAMYWMKNPQAAGYWDQQYQREAALLNNESRRARRDDMEIASNPAGGQDNIQQGTQ